jgi:hypothetical protein
MGCIGVVFKFIGLAAIGIVLLGLIGMCANQEPTSGVQSSSKAKQIFGSTKDSNFRDKFTEQQRKTIQSLVYADLWVQFYSEQAGIVSQPSGELVPIIKATKILKDYQRNELKAEKDYSDKEIIVTGTIDTVKTTIGGTAYLSLNAGEMFETILASFKGEYKEALSNLLPGEQYTMRCKCQGVTLGALHLADCIPIGSWLSQLADNILYNMHNIYPEKAQFAYENKPGKIYESVKKDIKNFLYIFFAVKKLPENHPLFQYINKSGSWDVEKYKKELPMIDEDVKGMLEELGFKEDVFQQLFLPKNEILPEKKIYKIEI